MCAGFVIVAEVIFEYSAQVDIINDDHMIQTLSTDASDHPLHEAVLPRTPRSGSGANGGMNRWIAIMVR